MTKSNWSDFAYSITSIIMGACVYMFIHTNEETFQSIYTQGDKNTAGVKWN